jgi:hypothetical protein
MNKKQVECFFNTFIKGYLLQDLLVLDKIKKNEKSGLGACTIPQAMTVISGIQLLGFLFGNNKKTNESKEHIYNFFEVTKDVYPNEKYSESDIKKIVQFRHGMMHSFFPKLYAKSIGICKSESENLFIRDLIENIEIESLNVSLLSSDFLLAVDYLENMITEQTDEVFFENIMTSLRELEYSNLLATTTTVTTMNIITQNERK